MNSDLLNLMIFLPLLGAAWVAALRGESRATLARWISLLTSLASLGLAVYLATRFDPSKDGYQFATDVPWISVINSHYHVGLDGTALLMILLTAVMTPVALAGAWKYIQKREKEFCALMLVLECALLGLFAARDLVLFYVFWEAVLLPMILIIGVWGGTRRIYATFKFVLFTALGSLLMFVAILVVYFKTRGVELPDHAPPGMDIDRLIAALAELRKHGNLTLSVELWLYGAFALAFGIKVPLVPVHTWLPDAHVEAPTPGSVMLAAVLLKMGGYGWLIIAVPLFPAAAELTAPALATLAVIGVIYGSLMATAQTDMKKLIAYSSVAHMGVAMLGLAVFAGSGDAQLRTLAFQGCVYIMLAHGVVSGALFLMSGMLYERRHTREIGEYGGLAGRTPVLAACFVVFSLASVALPLTANFVGELCVLLGAWSWSPVRTALTGTGMVLGAIYMLWLIHRVFFGKLANPKNAELPDASKRELSIMVPLILIVFLMGIYPKPFLRAMDGTIRRLSGQMHPEEKKEAQKPQVVEVLMLESRKEARP